MQLSEHLRALADDELAELLRHRPDLAGAVGGGFGALAGRAASRASLGRLLLRSDVGMLVVAEGLVALGPQTVDGLVEHLGADDRLGVVEAVDRLRRRGGVTVDADGVVAVAGQLTDLIPHPFGLGRPFAELALHATVAELTSVGAHLGVALAGSRKADIIAELAVHLANPHLLGAVLDEAPEDAQLLLVAMVRDRQPDIELPSWIRSSWAMRVEVDPRAWLASRGLLMSAGWEVGEVPREVGLALLPDGLAPNTPLRPPPLPTVDGPTPDRVDAEGGSAAARALDVAEALVRELAAAPAKLRKDGSLGVREARRLAKSIGDGERSVARLVELLAAAGIVELRPGHLVADRDARRWVRLDRPERWMVLVRTWADTDRIPSFALAPDDEGRARPALEAQYGPFDARAARGELLRQLAGVPDGRSVDFDAAWLPITWWAPTLWRVPQMAPAEVVGWFVEEAVLLGLVALDSPTSALRALADRRLDDLRNHASRFLASDQATFVVQADLTALALGALAPGVAERLGQIAERETATGGPRYRFTEASIRAAFDRGWTPAQVRAFLVDHALTGVPQALDYLIDDVERRYGHLIVHEARSVVVADDEAVLADVVGHRRSRALGLVPVAPTVAVSSLPPAELLAALRNAGYLPVDVDGALRLRGAAPPAADAGDLDADDASLLDRLAEDLADEPPASWFAPTGGRDLTPVEAAELVERLRSADRDAGAAPALAPGLAELRTRIRKLRRRQVRVAFLDRDDYVEVIGMVMAADDEWLHVYDAAEHRVASVALGDLVSLEPLHPGSADEPSGAGR